MEVLYEKKNTSPLNVAINAVLIVVFLALVAFFVFALNYSVCQVSGASMNDTLVNGQYVLLEKSEYTASVGDIIVFAQTKDGVTTQYVKRVVALEGDVVEFRSTQSGVGLYVNGVLQEETYIKENMLVNEYSWGVTFKQPYGHVIGLGEEHTVADDCVFALGDNRNNSMDSRYMDYIGDVKLTEVVGKVGVQVEKDSFFEWILSLIYGNQVQQEA